MVYLVAKRSISKTLQNQNDTSSAYEWVQSLAWFIYNLLYSLNYGSQLELCFAQPSSSDFYLFQLVIREKQAPEDGAVLLMDSSFIAYLNIWLKEIFYATDNY